MQEHSFSAGSKREAEFKFHQNGRKLEFRAIKIGIIKTTGIAVGTFCKLQDYLVAFLTWRDLLLDHFGYHKDEYCQLIEDFCETLSLGQIPQQWERSGWLAPCYHVFSSLIQERLPRSMDRGLQRYLNATGIHRDEHRRFLQAHFGDRMVRSASSSVRI